MMIKQILRGAALHLPLWLYRTIIKRNAIGVYYHVISNEPLAYIQNLYAYKPVDFFEDDLVYLKAHFNLISYAQLESFTSKGTKLPPRALILTFDDGLSQCYSAVRPLLLKYQLPCVFFVNTNFLDNRGLAADMKASLCIEKFFSADDNARESFSQVISRVFGLETQLPSDGISWIKSLAGNDPQKFDTLCELLGVDVKDMLAKEKPYLSSEQVIQLHADGFTIGAHSLGHEKLRDLSQTELEQNIVGSCQAVQELTKAPKIPFAFPFSADAIARPTLQDIKSKHPVVGLYFGGNGILTDCNFIFPRLCGDSPKSSSRGHSNLRFRIANAYLEALSEKLHRKKSYN